jgi:hypothetical protein
MAPIGLFLTGCAGSGKSWHAHRFINKYGVNGHHFSIKVVGFTARSIMEYDTHGYTTVAYANMINSRAMAVPQILVIEEVGMLSSHDFTMLIRISQKADLIVLVGDVYQIKPINGEMFFNCSAWHTMFDTATVHRVSETDFSFRRGCLEVSDTPIDNKSKIIVLQGSKRSNDDELNIFLNQLRKSLRTQKHTPAIDTIRHILSRKPVCNKNVVVTSKHQFKGVHLFYRCADVDMWNNQCGGLQLNGPCAVTENIINNTTTNMYYARNGENATIYDKAMMCSQQHESIQLIYADRIKSVVQFDVPYYRIDAHRWVPATHVSPGYATTIHRSQGDTFTNGVVIHPARFPSGCVFYVAASRCDTFEGLVVDGHFDEHILLRGLDESTIAFINKYQLD